MSFAGIERGAGVPGLDMDALRRAYYSPIETEPLDHVPTKEELLGLYERTAVEDCLACGGDPAEQGLGEFGSLIGGPGKPLRRFNYIEVERLVPIAPVPLDWFDHPLGRKAGTGEADREWLRGLIGSHLAGSAVKLTPQSFLDCLRTGDCTELESRALGGLLQTMWEWEMYDFFEKVPTVSPYQMARAIHRCGVRNGRLTHWIHLDARHPAKGQGRERSANDARRDRIRDASVQ